MIDLSSPPADCGANPVVFVSTDPGAINNNIPVSTFLIPQGVDFAVLTYRFITQEVPGGFFGTEFNDFFEVSLTISPPSGDARTDKVSVSNSILGLDLGAFNADGETGVYKLSIDIADKAGQFLTVAAGVANAVDNAFQSAICGDLTFVVGVEGL